MTGERRSSVIYSSSIGKAGLYSPQDYLPVVVGREDEERHSIGNDDEESEEGYYEDEDANLNTLLPGYGTCSAYGAISEVASGLEAPLRCISAGEVNTCGASNGIVGVKDTEDKSLLVTTTYFKEAKVLVTSSLPLMVTFMLQYSLTLSSIFSVAHLGSKELGALTLGAMTANITGFAAVQGLSTCLDTLCSQSYGARNYKLVGVLLQRCCVLALIMFSPVTLIWYYYSDELLMLLVRDVELAHLAGRYLKVVSFGMPAFILFEAGKRFLQCQGIFHASTVILLLCAPLNAALNYLLVWDETLGIGYMGAPISVVIIYWLMFLGLLLYVVFTKNKVNPRKCWGGFVSARQAFRNWDQMLGLALPGIVMVEAEFLGFELLTLFASQISTEALGAQSIVATVAASAYQIPFSISNATSSRVANYIGASLYKSCVITCKVALLLSFAVSSVSMAFIFFFRDSIASLFSNDQEVVSLVASALRILAVMQLFDAFNACTAGCLRGQGQQKIGGLINVVSFYVVGVPLAHYLAFVKDLGVNGLWYGITTALFCMSVCQGYAVFNCNWNELIRMAQDRCLEV